MRDNSRVQGGKGEQLQRARLTGNVGFRAWTATTTATATGASHVVDGRGRLREGYARLQRNLREKEKCRRQLQRAGPQETFPENSSQGIGELPKCPESSDYGYSIAYGASGLVYQEKGLKTRRMLACQEDWASPGQEPPATTGDLGESAENRQTGCSQLRLRGRGRP